MPAVIAALSAALNFLNAPVVKGALAWIFGLAWARWPGAQKKAIPALTMTGSLVLTLAQVIAAVSAVATQEVAPANFTAAVVAATGQPTMAWAIWNTVVGTVLPVIAATGAYSWPKNFGEWLQMGAKVVVESKRKR